MKTVKLNNSVLSEDWLDSIIKYGEPKSVTLHPEVFKEMVELGLVDNPKPVPSTGFRQVKGTFMNVPIYLDMVTPCPTTASQMVCSDMPLPKDVEQEILKNGYGVWPKD